MPISTASEGDLAEALAQAVRAAAAEGAALRIVGGDTKAGLGRPVRGRALPMAGHRGVVDYQPSELVITARAGTPIAQVEALLDQHAQMLAFEPLLTGAASTLGGVVAAGLAGPRRPFAGAVRDQVLGVTLLDGQGRRLRLGGTVFKNVAGFDGFRLMAGAFGTLGVLLEVSLRVAPRPARELTLGLEEPWPKAQARLADLLRRPSALSAAAHDGTRLMLRLSGSETAVSEAARAMGGEPVDGEIWPRLRRPQGLWPQSPGLWRLSLPRTAPPQDWPGSWLVDWAGGQVWLASEAPAQELRALAAAVSGHASRFRGPADEASPFEPLPPAMLALHRRLKAAFDPAGVLNPGRLYPEL